MNEKLDNRATYTIGAEPAPEIRQKQGLHITEGIAPTMSHAEVAAKIRANLPERERRDLSIEQERAAAEWAAECGKTDHDTSAECLLDADALRIEEELDRAMLAKQARRNNEGN